MDQAGETSSERDFDFWMGSWEAAEPEAEGAARRLRRVGRVRGDERGPAAPGRARKRGRVPDRHAGGFIGMSFRFFDPEAKQWSIYWADSRGRRARPAGLRHVLDGIGVFEGADVFDGKPILVRFTWSGATTPTPRWEQASRATAGKRGR